MKIMIEGKVDRTSKGKGAEHAFTEIQGRILDLRLQPGSLLDEQSLGAEVGLSRTPVREALTQLASIGLVELTPNRGARVAPLELAEAPELLETLELFQRATNRWAAARRSEFDIDAIEKANMAFVAAVEASNTEIMGRVNYEYHSAISRACGNRFLTDAAGKVEIRTARLIHVAYNSIRSEGDMKGYYDLVCQHHSDMFQAIKDRDGDKADRLATEHTELFRRRLLEFVGHSAATRFQIRAV